MTDQSRIDREVRANLYRFIAENARPPIAAELADSLGRRPVEIEDSLRRLHDQHLIVLAPGTPYIWMANPFSALPTPYRATVDGREYWANCVWDAFGVIALVGGTGTVSARCGDCGEALSVEVKDRHVDPSDYVVHYAVPARHWYDDIGFN